MQLQNKSPAYRASLCGVLTALALILSYLESLLPVFFAVPGVKLGLANSAALFALYALKTRDAWLISGLRVVLSSLLFGSGATLIYSACGAMVSLTVMTALKRFGRFSALGVSVAGGVAHNVGQIAAAIVLMGTKSLVYYLGVLCISGVLAGAAIGLLTGLLLHRIDVLSRR